MKTTIFHRSYFVIHIILLMSLTFFISSCAYNNAMVRENNKNKALHGGLSKEQGHKVALDIDRRNLQGRKMKLLGEISDIQLEIDNSQNKIDKLNMRMVILDKQQKQKQEQRKQKQLKAERLRSKKDIQRLKLKVRKLKESNKQKERELEKYL